MIALMLAVDVLLLIYIMISRIKLGKLERSVEDLSSSLEWDFKDTNERISRNYFFIKKFIPTDIYEDISKRWEVRWWL